MDLSAPFFPLGAFGARTGLVIGVGIGLAFGFFLERAGLGNGRKLAAQFYLTDLTVFKVMFTAIVTAMLGVFWLARTGVLDLSLIALTPTYLVPQIAGGLLFGAGFVIGGYCPGTSCVAAASGKFDGLAVFAGMMMGILLYGELYPHIQPFADLTSMGQLSFAGLLAVRPGVLVGGVALAALVAFTLADRLEKRSGSLIRLLGLAVAAAGLLAIALPGETRREPPTQGVIAQPKDSAATERLPSIRGGGCFR
jgi:uncharacterized protein